MGLGRLELPTSRLSSARSNQLSYKPKTRPLARPDPENGRRGARRMMVITIAPRTWRGLVQEERETETAASCLMSDDKCQRTEVPTIVPTLI